MMVLFLLSFLFTSSDSLALWAQMDIKLLSCTSPLIVTGEVIKVSEDKYRFQRLASPKFINTYREGTLKVDKLLSLKKGQFPYEKEMEKKSALDILVVAPHHTGPLDHMTIRHRVGHKGIWFLNKRDSWTGHFSPYRHPHNPYPLKNLEKVKEAIKKCP